MTTATTVAKPRMRNPAAVIPEAMKAIQALTASTMQGDAPAADARARAPPGTSQINGCPASVSLPARSMPRPAGESDERLFAVAAWREAPDFTEAERARAGAG